MPAAACPGWVPALGVVVPAVVVVEPELPHAVAASAIDPSATPSAEDLREACTVMVLRTRRTST